jgi:hypothetical protein
MMQLIKLKYIVKKINLLKNNIQNILYFFNCSENRTFIPLENKIYEELIEHKTIQIIYVVTKSPKK